MAAGCTCRATVRASRRATSRSDRSDNGSCVPRVGSEAAREADRSAWGDHAKEGRSPGHDFAEAPWSATGSLASRKASRSDTVVRPAASLTIPARLRVLAALCVGASVGADHAPPSRRSRARSGSPPPTTVDRCLEASSPPRRPCARRSLRCRHVARQAWRHSRAPPPRPGCGLRGGEPRFHGACVATAPLRSAAPASSRRSIRAFRDPFS